MQQHIDTSDPHSHIDKGAREAEIKGKPSSRLGTRLLLDARKLGHGGIGVYTRNIIEGILRFAKNDIALTILIRPDYTLPEAWKGNLLTRVDTTPLYSFSELFGFSRNIEWKEFDVFHVPHYTLPFFVPIPTIITIHDLIHIYSPESWYYPFIATPLIFSSAYRADKIVVVSEATERELIEFPILGAPLRKKVAVIPNSIGPELEDALTNERKGDYLFTVISTDKPHKGLADLIKAFADVRKEYPELSLVVAGQGVSTCTGEDGVVMRGELSEQELYALYAGARAVVVPSLHEGFSLPTLEAKMRGARVVVRPIPPLLEIAGPDDVICSDLSIESLSEGMKRALSKEVPDMERERGRLQQKYSLRRGIESLLGIYNARP